MPKDSPPKDSPPQNSSTHDSSGAATPAPLRSSPIQAVIFDLDGVLIDSEPVWEEVRRDYVARRGGHWQPDSQTRLMGMSTPEWATYLSVELEVGVEPDQVATDVIAEMGRRYATGLPLLPGAVDAVRRMAARWPLGLASSSPRVLIDRVLSLAGLTGDFAASLSTEQVGRGKPAPDVYLAVAGRLGVAPAATVAVEDSSNGLRAAAGAGMVVLAIPHPAYPPAPDALARADLILADLNALDVTRIEELSRPTDKSPD